MNLLRRLHLSRLLLVCGAVVALGAGLAAIASALGSGPTPAPLPLAQAVENALNAPRVDGVSARITFTNHLLEGANLAGGGDGGGSIASNPLVSGASGRLWVASDGRMRIELQSEKGDTEIIYDGHTVSVYDTANNAIYRYTPEQHATDGPADDQGAPPSIADVERAIAHLREHAVVSGATPSDVAGQPAYTVRISPKEGGSLLGGAEVSFDAGHGLPLRTAIYSSKSSAPVVELAATEVSYGPVDSSVFSLAAPSDASVHVIEPGGGKTAEEAPDGQDGHGKLTGHGHGISTIGVLETPDHSARKQGGPLEQLPTVSVKGTSASELRTALGTILTFERSGVRYVVAGAVEAGQVEALAREL
ncbi:MAG TPA: outer membrane lipoprotein carrier protein LolA [Solirubrobacteraceae bacterium]|nr:outer membrane lipoprotein carrier protein LolA [Solirubrobacteraceae bacterium]